MVGRRGAGSVGKTGERTIARVAPRRGKTEGRNIDEAVPRYRRVGTKQGRAKHGSRAAELEARNTTPLLLTLSAT